MLSLAIIILLSYLVGSFPTSIVVGRMLRQIDIRDYGSGNAGGTNVFRVLGWKPGLLVSAVDVGKGMIATLLVCRIRVDAINLDPILVQIIAGVSAVIGHIWTVMANFRGGKGVATGAGMIFSLFPWAALICLVVFVSLVLTTRYVSVSSMVAASCFPLALMFLDVMFEKSLPQSVYIFSILVAMLIVYTHRSNIRRLINGTENQIHLRKR